MSEAIQPRDAALARIAELEQQNERAKEGAKEYRALSRLSDKVDYAYMDIADKERATYNAQWLRDYNHRNGKIPIDIQYDDEYQRVRNKYDDLVEDADEDTMQQIIYDNKAEIKDLKKKAIKRGWL